MKKRILILSALVLSYSALNFADDTAVATPASTIVTVNGVAITDHEVKHFISKLAKPVPPGKALQEIINIELLVQTAKDKGMMKDEELVFELKRSASGLIASHFLQQQIMKMNITMDDLKARYQKDYIDGDQAKEYNANHILVKTEQEAKDIISKLDNAEVFTELAKTLSTGPSGKNGGALGWFKSADMVPPFSQAAMSLAKGQYSKNPVKTQFGWHVIYLNDSRKLDPPTFDSVSKKISSAMASEEINNIMKKLHASARIEFPEN